MKSDFERSKIEAEFSEKILEAWRFLNENVDDLIEPVTDFSQGKLDDGHFDNQLAQVMSKVDCDEKFGTRLVDLSLMFLIICMMELDPEHLVPGIDMKMNEE